MSYDAFLGAGIDYEVIHKIVYLTSLLVVLVECMNICN